MATLNEAPEQLRHWIKELDGQIGFLNEQRDAFVMALAAFGDPDDAVAIDQGRVAPIARDRAQSPAPKPPLAKGMPARLKKAAARPKAKPRESKYDYAEVARVANAAVRGGTSASAAVAQRFNVSGVMGDQLLYKARKLGHDIPKYTAKVARPSNVTPIMSSDVNTSTHPAATRPGPQPGARAFTPDDTLKLLDRA